MQVHLGHDQRNIVVETEPGRIVDHHRPRRGRPRRVLGADGATGRKQPDLDVLEIKVVEHLDPVELAAVLQTFAGGPRACEQHQPIYRKAALLQEFPHRLAHGPRGAGDGYVDFFHAIFSWAIAAMTASAISSVPTRRRCSPPPSGNISAVRKPSSSTAATAASIRSAAAAEFKL